MPSKRKTKAQIEGHVEHLKAVIRYCADNMTMNHLFNKDGVKIIDESVHGKAGCSVCQSILRLREALEQR